MIMSPLALRRYMQHGNRHFIGGDSESNQDTKNYDGRVVGGEQSQNASISGSTGVSVVSTDHGAVSGSLALALKGVEGAQQIALQAQAGSNELLSGVFNKNANQAATLTQAVVDLKTSDVRTLVVAGLAVVGIVAVQLLKKAH